MQELSPAESSLSNELSATNGAPSRRQRLRDALSYLQRHWSELFNPQAMRPLAVGIGDRLQEHAALHPEVDAQGIAWAVADWTGQLRYLRVLAKGGPRYNLAGQQDGEVSAEHQALAATQVADIVKLQKTKYARKAENIARDQAAREAKAERLEKARIAAEEAKVVAKAAAKAAKEQARAAAAEKATQAPKKPKPRPQQPNGNRAAPNVQVKKPRTFERPAAPNATSTPPSHRPASGAAMQVKRARALDVPLDATKPATPSPTIQVKKPRQVELPPADKPAVGAPTVQVKKVRRVELPDTTASSTTANADKPATSKPVITLKNRRLSEKSE